MSKKIREITEDEYRILFDAGATVRVFSAECERHCGGYTGGDDLTDLDWFAQSDNSVDGWDADLCIFSATEGHYYECKFYTLEDGDVEEDS